jgi:hypothetical protein
MNFFNDLFESKLKYARINLKDSLLSDIQNWKVTYSLYIRVREVAGNER